MKADDDTSSLDVKPISVGVDLDASTRFAWFVFAWIILAAAWLGTLVAICGCTLKLDTPAPPLPLPSVSMPESADQADWLWAIGYPVLLAAVGWLKRRETKQRNERNKIERCAKLLIGAIEGAGAEGANSVKAEVAYLKDPWINEKVRTMYGVVQPTRPLPPPPAKGRT